MRVRVRVVLREFRARAGVALLTRRDALRGPDRRAGVARRLDFVGRVAVRAGRDGREAELGNLPVVGVAVGLQLGVVAAAALLENREPPHVGRSRDRVGRMAVGADRDARVALRELLTVDRRRVLVQDLRVARAARSGHVGARDGALRVAPGAPDLVVTVARRAVRGDLQARFLEGLAVDRVVEAHGLAPVGAARPREDLRVAVAAHAGRGQVEVVRPGRRVARGLDVVLPVAVRAPGRLARGVLRARSRVPALRIVLDLLRVTRGAVGPRELFRVGEVRRLREVRVAVHARGAGDSVHGRVEDLLVHEDGGPVGPRGRRVLVAGEAIVVGGRLRRRGRCS